MLVGTHNARSCVQNVVGMHTVLDKDMCSMHRFLLVQMYLTFRFESFLTLICICMKMYYTIKLD